MAADLSDGVDSNNDQRPRGSVMSVFGISRDELAGISGTWRVEGAEPSGRLVEELSHPTSAITATATGTRAAIIRGSTRLPRDTNDIHARSAIGLTTPPGGDRRHPRMLGSMDLSAAPLPFSARLGGGRMALRTR
jgi:hypothetical protein